MARINRVKKIINNDVELFFKSYKARKIEFLYLIDINFN